MLFRGIDRFDRIDGCSDRRFGCNRGFGRCNRGFDRFNTIDDCRDRRYSDRRFHW